MDIKKMVVPFNLKQMDESDDEFFEFEGHASTFGNVDLGRDRVMPGAFEDTINEHTTKGTFPPVLWQHDMHMPLGVYVHMMEDSHGLFVKGKMPKADDFVRGRVVPQMKAKSVCAMSIGYSAIDWEISEDVRNLKKIRIHEISLVTFPMNTMACVTNIKNVTSFGDLPIAHDSLPWDADAASGRVRQFTDANGYKKSFFYCDSDNPENESGYKLPFADVIDGKLMAIPRGIFSAAAAMRGVRGSVDLHEGVKAEVENNINKYYKKMDRESPLKEKHLSISMLDLKYLTVRDIEGILTNENAKFTKKAGKKIISYLNVKDLREEGKSIERDAPRDSGIVGKKLNEILNLLEK